MASTSNWKFYAWRPVGNTFIDNDVQLRECSLKYTLSAINSGQIILPGSDVVPIAPDGRPVWGRWDTLLLAERNGNLDWAGIADVVAPGQNGVQVTLVGLSAWLSRVEYSGNYQTWETNAFNVARELIDHATGKPRGINFTRDATSSSQTVGDPNPPPKPRKPPRHKNEKKSDYLDSTRYTTWETDLQNWKDAYGDKQKYKIVWWEHPTVGEEFNNLAREVNFDWREQYSWTSGSGSTPIFKINFADSLAAVRDDFAVIDGVNVVGRLTPNDDDEHYANKVIAVGAGHGRKTRRQTASVDDGRLYSMRYDKHKRQKNMRQLQRQANKKLAHTRRIDPQIGTVNVYDVAGMAPAESLKPGDIITVKSDFVVPRVNVLAMVRSKTELPLAPGTVQLELETQQS